jgi:signal transduction histidine kinase
VIQKVRAFVARKEVNKVPTDLNLLLTDSMARISQEARRRGVTIKRDLARDLPMVEVDPVQVEQVMDNLFTNAIEAMNGMPVVSRTMVVRSALRSDGNTVEACVEDCGHGISTDHLPKIFESFHTSKNGGMGLGLALSRSIAEAHGGSLHARNLETGGSIFCLVLPTHQS